VSASHFSEAALTDALGVRHARAPDARIACLVPSITELICALGLAPQLVARTGFCIHPKEVVADIPKVGGTKEIDLDKLRALAPTHVVLNLDENTRAMADALSLFVPHLVVTHPNAPEDNLALFELIGGAFGREHEARLLCARLRDALAAARAAAAQWAARKVLYLIWKDPWMTVSPDTYIARTLATVGWQVTGWETALLDDTRTAQGAARYPKVVLEEAARDADLVLLSTEPYMFREQHVRELQAHLQAQARTQAQTPAQTPAAQGMRGRVPRVALIDGEMASWYGPRAIDGLAYLPRLRERLERH